MKHPRTTSVKRQIAPLRRVKLLHRCFDPYSTTPKSERHYCDYKVQTTVALVTALSAPLQPWKDKQGV